VHRSQALTAYQDASLVKLYKERAKRNSWCEQKTAACQLTQSAYVSTQMHQPGRSMDSASSARDRWRSPNEADLVQDRTIDVVVGHVNDYQDARTLR
jgi:hypothetical protein